MIGLYRSVGFLLAILILTVLYIVPGHGIKPTEPVTSKDEALNHFKTLSVDVALGEHKKEQHASRLEQTPIDGTLYTWADYADWGKELIHNGQVNQPPQGTTPSQRISENFTCTNCHNVTREDTNLVKQDPEARMAMILEQTLAGEEAELALMTGTSFWGIVNRETFYNDTYSIYRSLVLADGETQMNYSNLEDAIQICSHYCSNGRYLEDWELLSIMTYFWELELTIADLDLPDSILVTLQAMLSGPHYNQSKAEEAKQLMKRFYLQRSASTHHSLPTMINTDNANSQIEIGYDDGQKFIGNAKQGKKVYQASCAECHGINKVISFDEGILAQSLNRFHEAISVGTSPNSHIPGIYMPKFTLERLSRQQATNIYAFLHELNG